MQFETTPPLVRAKPQNGQGDERRNKNHKYLFIYYTIVTFSCRSRLYGRFLWKNQSTTPILAKDSFVAYHSETLTPPTDHICFSLTWKRPRCLKLLVLSSSQSEHRIRFILPARLTNQNTEFASC